MHTKIPAGKPIVLRRLRHGKDCDVLGFSRRRGDPIVSPAPDTGGNAETLRGMSQEATRAGREMRQILSAR